MQQKLFRSALGAAVLVAFGATAAQAQNYRVDLGVNGGGSWWSAMLDEDHLGVGVADRNVTFEPGWVVGGQVGFWLSPRIGLRANGAYTERPLSETDNLTSFDADFTDLAEDINISTVTGDLLFRLNTPNESWQGMEFLPYVALGAGINHTDPAESSTVVEIGGETQDGAIFVSGSQERAFLLSDKTTFTGNVALGGDVRLAPNWAVRLEVSDRIYDPQIRALNFDATGGTFTFVEAESEDIGNVTHWVSGTVGVHLLLGLQQPERVVIAPPPPAPTPQPRPEPEPEPAPQPERMDALRVCVVDPGAMGGLRTVDAYYRHSTRDTVMVETGDTVALRTRLPNVALAPSATWYVQGQPLVFEFDRAPQRAEFLSVGTSRVVPADQLTYLGRMQGVPVYAAREDMSGVGEQWNELRDARADADIDDIVEQRAELRTAFDDVEVLYVPVQPTGCVFQALQRQEEVRKGAR